MAETIYFAIPPTGQNEVEAVKIYWSQGSDGETWGDPIAESLLSALPYDALSGQYSWTVAAADPAQYHLLTTESATGVKSTHGAVLPPRSFNTVTRREVNNIGEPIISPEGQPQEDVKIKFLLTKDGLSMNGKDAETGETIASQEITTKTNKNGEFSVWLWPTDRASTTMQYRCTAPGIKPFFFSLESGDTAVKFSTLQA